MLVLEYLEIPSFQKPACHEAENTTAHGWATVHGLELMGERNHPLHGSSYTDHNWIYLVKVLKPKSKHFTPCRLFRLNSFSELASPLPTTQRNITPVPSKRGARSGVQGRRELCSSKTQPLEFKHAKLEAWSCFSQNHKMVGVGRDLCGSSGPTLLPKQGHLQQAVEDLVQAGLEYLQRRRLLDLDNFPGVFLLLNNCQ